MDGLVRGTLAPYGNALLAVRYFAPGEVVLRETPLLATREAPELLDRLYDTHSSFGIRAELLGKDASIDFSMQLLQFCLASESVRQTVLRELFSPDPDVHADAPYVRAARQYATQLYDAQRDAPGEFAASVLGAAAGCAAELVVRVVLAWVCNCYASYDGGGALYEYGSLVNHCCEGSCRYRFCEDQTCGQGGQGVFVAVRPIQAGEAITTSYLGWDEQTLLSTRMRRSLLARTKLFHCTCARCSRGLDLYRSVPCPGRTGAGCGSKRGARGGGGGRSSGSFGGCGDGGGGSGGESRGHPEDHGGHVDTAAATAAVRLVKAAGGFDGEGEDATVDDAATGGVPAAAAARSPGDEAPGAAAGGDSAGGGGAGAGPTGDGAITAASRPPPPPADDASGAGGGGGDGGSGFLYWSNERCSNGDPQPWACLGCGLRCGEEEVRAALRRRAVAAGLPRLAAGDPEALLEEQVTAVGDQLDWCDIAVSLGAVRRLGAACLQVLGPRHWTTNRCRHTVLGLCTAALSAVSGGSRVGGASSAATVGPHAAASAAAEASATTASAVGDGSVAAAMVDSCGAAPVPKRVVGLSALRPFGGDGHDLGAAAGAGAGSGSVGGGGDGGPEGGGGGSGGGGGFSGGGNPHVNPHLGHEQLLQHTLHHHSLHVQAQQQQALHEREDERQQRQQQQQQQQPHARHQQQQPAQQEQQADQQQQQLPPPLTPPAHSACGADAARAGVPTGGQPDSGCDGAAAAAAAAASARLCDPRGDISGGACARGAAAAAGALSLSSTVWSVVEVDALVLCICEELQALWQWQEQHTADEPAVVLKAVARQASTALMDAVKDEACSGGRVASLALAVAEATAARLAAAYAAAPYFDVSGEEWAEAVSVVQLCPLIRRALDIE